MTRGTKKRLLFNFLSLPLGLLLVYVILWLIALYKQPGYYSLGPYLKLWAIGWILVIVLWHIRVLADLSNAKGQRQIFRWNLAALLYPYAIGLCFFFSYSARHLTALYHRHNIIKEMEAVTVDVQAMPLTVGTENAPVVAVYTSSDTAYLLTLSTYMHHADSLLGKLRLPGYRSPLPVDYYALHCYALTSGEIREVGMQNIVSDSVDKTTSVRNPDRSLHILTTKLNAKPCQGIYSVKQPHTLVDKCIDTNKILGTLNGYYASSRYSHDKEWWVPVNYVDKYNTCYATVWPEAENIYKKRMPMAHIAVFKNGKTIVYRAWLPGKNNYVQMRKCFVQGNDCYIYDASPIGSNGPFLCKFRLPDQ